MGAGRGYGAAVALLPYLLIKVWWVIGSLAGAISVGDGFTPAGWVLLNTVTIGMAVIGITLALALVRPWGMRIPGWLVAFVAWAGAGFLVSVLPYAALSTLLDSGADAAGSGAGDAGEMPDWQGALAEFGFIGTGLGLALAFPAHMRRRWPDVFTGRVGDRPPAARPWAAVVAALVGLAWLYWTAGGTLGIAQPGNRDTRWYMLTGLGALWALVGAAAVWALARARPARLPRAVPMALGWIGSGSLFAWSGWKLPLTLIVGLTHPDGVVPPEEVAVAMALQLAAVVAGAGMLRALVRSRAYGEAPSPTRVGERARPSAPERERVDRVASARQNRNASEPQ